MKINSKLRSFTIIEVTVAMLLASVSIAIGYTSYRVISSSYRQFDIKNKMLSEFILVDKLLKKDISGCIKMVRKEQGISLVTKGGEIVYYFYPQFILRNQYNLRSDTLSVPGSEFKTLFEQKEVFEGELADYIRVIFVLQGKSIPMRYTKEYSAEQLFK